MNYMPDESDVVFQELPGEISLTFSITGCGKHCPGCHSPHLQDSRNGVELTAQRFLDAISAYDGFITNVLFFGGEWEPDTLVQLFILAQTRGLKTTLFTADLSVDNAILNHLDFIKTGPYIEALGGLDSRTTNQRVYNLTTGTDITYKYWSVLDT